MQHYLENNTINRYLPFALLYLFFNAVGLPEGLLYTTILTPLFMVYSLNNGYTKPYLWFIVLALLMLTIHHFIGIHYFYYFKSLIVAFCNFSFCVSFWIYLKKSTSQQIIFSQLVAMNTLLVVIALFNLLLPAMYQKLWYHIPFTPGITFPRLKLFWSEASVYSLYITPLFFYFLYKTIQTKQKMYSLYLIAIIISLLLSMSIGVILSIVLSVCIVAVYHFRFFFSYKKFNRFLIGFAILTVVYLSWMILYQPNHPLQIRFLNIFSGADTSARGRTYEAFILADKILSNTNYWFGIGWGQLKLLGRQTVLSYYQYSNIPDVVRIPNTCAETLITFGAVGLSIRFIIEIALFIKTKTYSNPYRLGLFIFIFIYQFTGSYITNIAEYVIWIMAFSKSFTEFNLQKND